MEPEGSLMCLQEPANSETLSSFVKNFFFFFRGELLVPRLTYMLEDHPFLAARDLFNILAVIHHFWRSSPSSASR